VECTHCGQRAQLRALAYQVRRAALNLLGEDEGAQRATASVLMRVGNNGYFGQVWFGRSPQAAT
jgi:hypothetical protein